MIKDEIKSQIPNISTWNIKIGGGIFDDIFFNRLLRPFTANFFFKVKRILSIKEKSTKRLLSKPPQIISSLICNNSPLEQELSTHELEFTVTVSKSITSSTSVTISKEFTSSLSSEVSFGSIVNMKGGISFTDTETSSSSKSETHERSVEKKVKILSQKIRVPANSTIKVLNKCSTYTSKTLYLIDVELDSDTSYYNYRCRGETGEYRDRNFNYLGSDDKWFHAIRQLTSRGEDEVNVILVPDINSYRYVIKNIPIEVMEDSYHTNVVIELTDS